MNGLKFAVATDNSNEPSFFCKEGKYYRLLNSEDVTHTDLPYTAFFTYPEIFNGHFINLKFDTYPDENFDLIFAAIEKNTNYLNTLRELYPNAIIVGMYKEYYNHNQSVRNYIIDNTEAFSFPYFNIDFYEKFGLNKPKKPVIIPQPLNHIAIQNRFGNYKVEDKEDLIFNYYKNTPGRYSINNEDILKKTNLKSINYKGPRGFQPFAEYWSPCRYMLSTDKNDLGGVMSSQCIALRTIMVGSNTDYQQILFPNLVGTDVDYLLDKIDKLHTNKKYRDDTIKYAYDTLLQTYSFTAVKKKIIDLYNSLRS